MVKICLTGGPCGGKSSSLSVLDQELSARGYKVFIVSEAATELINGGIAPVGLSFQKKVLAAQLAKEKIFDEAAKEAGTDKVVILCDRGILDQLAYMTKEELLEMAKEYGLTETDLSSRYDAVYHLVTAANGTDFYTKSNNKARYESAEEAIIKDNKTISAWTGHPHLRIIDNSTGFDEKIQRLVDDVFHFLGEPEPMEVERKFLIKKPTEDVLNNIEYISKTSIVQTYLRPNGNTERRVRQRGSKETSYSFYYTEKTEVSLGNRVEVEKKISGRQYLDLLLEADTSRHSIVKDRYCFFYENQYFEMDIYPFSEDKAILEIELKSIDDQVNIPEYISVIEEVTGDEKYKNSTLAITQSFE